MKSILAPVMAAAVATAAGSASVPAFAQAFPTKTITIVVPTAVGENEARKAQDSPGRTSAQVPDTAKSPVVVIRETEATAEPTLVTVNGRAALVVPTIWSPNESVDGIAATWSPALPAGNADER